ncbi:MAG TPA: CheR family methyltransferase [Longimicrobium sp.]|nr:CheR family methyltransferase [Longimicrobium sp.]
MSATSDRECVELLQWALPRLGLRWHGFRKLRGQVCKRILRRVKELGLPSVTAYRPLLETDAAEWARFDGFCRVTITRFYRDRAVFDALRDVVLPELCAAAVARGAPTLRCWSAGCASGEEPYTLAVLFEYALAPRFPGLGLEVRATDSEAGLLQRAGRACYERATLREVPEDWVASAFTVEQGAWCLRPELRRRVTFLQEDLRARMPEGPFDVICCRNLAFTYFEPDVQRRVLGELVARLGPGGALVIGGHESLPEPLPGNAGPALTRHRHLPLFRRG